MTGVLIRKGRDTRDASVHKGKAMRGHGARRQPPTSKKREASEETNPAGTWILDFQPPQL